MSSWKNERKHKSVWILFLFIKSTRVKFFKAVLPIKLTPPVFQNAWLKPIVNLQCSCHCIVNSVPHENGFKILSSFFKKRPNKTNNNFIEVLYIWMAGGWRMRNSVVQKDLKVLKAWKFSIFNLEFRS